MEINVIMMDLPESVGEIVTRNEDGSHSIFINSKHTYEMQKESYLHALEHIENGDFDSDLTVQEIESQYG